MDKNQVPAMMREVFPKLKRWANDWFPIKYSFLP
jgi:hypothetical protein